MADCMLFIAKEAPEELFDELVDLRVLTHLVSAEGRLELVIGLFIIKTGLDLPNKPLNPQLFFHLGRDLRLLGGLVLPSIIVFLRLIIALPLTKLLEFALFKHLFVERINVLRRLDVPPSIITILGIVIYR